MVSIGVMVSSVTVSATNAPPVQLGSTAHFLVLAGAGITFTGPTNSTLLTGDIGTFPTTTITGLGNVILDGVNHAGDSVTQTAKTDLVTAYIDAVGRSATVTYPAASELGGLTLIPGVHRNSTSFAITGTLTLDAQGNPDAVWIFQAGSTLITAAASMVSLTNGAQARNVFWQVGSSATLGTYSVFRGTILAETSITMTTGAMIEGRTLAKNGTVTFDQQIGALPMPEAPRFTAIYREIGDSMTVVLRTTPYFLLTLEACPDLLLTNWTTIATDTPTESTWTNTDFTATSAVTQRFYRATLTL